MWFNWLITYAYTRDLKSNISLSEGGINGFSLSNGFHITVVINGFYMAMVLIILAL